MCRRVKDGQTCGTDNPARKRNCTRCGKPRQRRETSKTRHEAVLRDLSYEECIQINGGEHCGICGVSPKTRRLDRDHEHKGKGAIRGLLCIRCNLALPNRVTLEWLRAAVAYLERFEQRRGQQG
jgi:hypothetical protein